MSAGLYGVGAAAVRAVRGAGGDLWAAAAAGARNAPAAATRHHGTGR